MRSPAFRPRVEEDERRETVADLLSAVGLVAAAGHRGLRTEQVPPPVSSAGSIGRAAEVPVSPPASLAIPTTPPAPTNAAPAAPPASEPPPATREEPPPFGRAPFAELIPTL